MTVPRGLSSIVVLILIWLAVMTGAGWLLPHELDWRVLAWLGDRVAPQFSPDVGIVDVAWDPSDIARNRLRIADFLDGLVKSGARPAAVILDVEFDPCQTQPCGEPMESARSALVSSIERAVRVFPVFATEEPSVGRDDQVSGPVDRQDPQIYAALSGAAHTRFTSIPDSEGLFYRLCYPGVPVADANGSIQGTEAVWSMVARVLMTPREFASAPPCDDSHVAVRVGDGSEETVYRFSDARTFGHFSQFDPQSYAIVGTLAFDRSAFAQRSGPELLGWALSNAIDQGSLVGKTRYYDAQPQNAMLLVLVPVFAGLTVIAFAAAFFVLRRTRLRSFRGRLPILAGVAAGAAGLAIFAGFEAWMLASHHLQPQVTLVSIGVIASAALCGVRGRQIQRDEAEAIEPPPEETYDYDVFISYAHEEGAWVSEHVYRAFRDAVLPDERKLSVFFDTSSIRSGTSWQTKLALAIDGSKFIVPVYSDIYFTKAYCLFEIKRAHRKWVLAGEASRCVLPIMRGHPKIYAPVDDIQALSIDDHPDLIRRHVAEVVERLSRQTAAGAAR
jgi:hypothetical protein